MSLEDDRANDIRKGLTEAALAERFSVLLSGGAPRRAFPSMSGIYQEVPGIQGVADFVGIRIRNWPATSARLDRQFSHLAKGPSAEIVAHLRRPHTIEYLLSHSRYSEGVCRRALAALVDSGLIQRHAALFKPARALSIPPFEIFFFELKLSKWRRALAQAIQAKAYADKVFCVFPSGNNLLHTRTPMFNAMNVGVLYFDPNRMTIRECVRASKVTTSIQAYRLEILLRLASLECSNRR